MRLPYNRRQDGKGAFPSHFVDMPTDAIMMLGMILAQWYPVLLTVGANGRGTFMIDERF